MYNKPCFRKLMLLLSLVTACILLPVVAHASPPTENPPTFKNPEVTAFVQEYAEFANQYSLDMKAYTATIKSQDNAKIQEATKKIKTTFDNSAVMQAKANLVGPKLEPGETPKFSEFLRKCALKMAEASKG